MTTAYWISPKGQLATVTQSHILEVIVHPEKFGYTKQKIARIYKKHNERLGLEGAAREEIIRNLVANGWIRIREYNKPYYWSITAARFNKRTKAVIHKWANKITRTGIEGVIETDKSIPIKIELLATKKSLYDLSIYDITRRKWVDEIDLKKYSLVIKKSFEGFLDL